MGLLIKAVSLIYSTISFLLNIQRGMVCSPVFCLKYYELYNIEPYKVLLTI
jgi:hypothetical protein